MFVTIENDQEAVMFLGALAQATYAIDMVIASVSFARVKELASQLMQVVNGDFTVRQQVDSIDMRTNTSRFTFMATTDGSCVRGRRAQSTLLLTRDMPFELIQTIVSSQAAVREAA